MRKLFKDDRQQLPIPAAKVDDPFKSGKVVYANDAICFKARQFRERAIENSRRLRILLQVLESVSARQQRPRAFSRFHAIEELSPDRPEMLSPPDRPVTK